MSEKRKVAHPAIQNVSAFDRRDNVRNGWLEGKL